MTEKHNSRSAKFLGGVNRVGCSRGVSLWGWRGTASQIDGGAAFCLWYPTSYVYCWGAKFRARGGGAFAWDGRCCGSRITTVTAGSGRELLASPPGQGRRVFLRLCGGRFQYVHKNGIARTAGKTGGVSSFEPPVLAPSGIRVSRFRAKGVAAVKPCGGNPSPTGSSAAGETLARADRKVRFG